VQFSVITADEAEIPYEGSYQVLDNAVLVVQPDDESQPTIQLSPVFWRQINEPRVETPPAPGPFFASAER
jgi:hypothetical protein